MTEHDATSGDVLLDPRVILATAVHSQPGVYALLLGSGVSTGAQVPTGWGVVNALVAQVATAAGESVDDDFDPEAWWSEHGDGQSLGYSSLLSTLATTPSARRALLASFFEPTEEEQEEGAKTPGPAHHAIATRSQDASQSWLSERRMEQSTHVMQARCARMTHGVSPTPTCDTGGPAPSFEPVRLGCSEISWRRSRPLFFLPS